MKFAALLRETAEQQPDVHQLFDTYKQLKKQLKQCPNVGDLRKESGDQQQWLALQEQEARFAEQLQRSLHELDNTLRDKEETKIIRLGDLETRAKTCNSLPGCLDVYRELVDFHGEVLLLTHWSILAYNATVKILKKHKKRTGRDVPSHPLLDELFKQPLQSTQNMTSLSKSLWELVELVEGKLSKLRLQHEATVEQPQPGGSAERANPHGKSIMAQYLSSSSSAPPTVGLLCQLSEWDSQEEGQELSFSGSVSWSPPQHSPHFKSLPEMQQQLLQMLQEQEETQQAEHATDAAEGAPGLAPGPLADQGASAHQSKPRSQAHVRVHAADGRDSTRDACMQTASTSARHPSGTSSGHRAPVPAAATAADAVRSEEFRCQPAPSMAPVLPPEQGSIGQQVNRALRTLDKLVENRRTVSNNPLLPTKRQLCELQQPQERERPTAGVPRGSQCSHTQGSSVPHPHP